MDYKILSRLYDYKASEANCVGLTQKAKEYWSISTLLWLEGSRREIGTLPIRLDIILNFKPNPPKGILLDLPRRFPNQNMWDWLTCKENWDPCIIPSFSYFFKELFSYVSYFFLWILAPWFHIRFRFIKTFINFNDGKLLDEGLTYGYIRNRQKDCAYYMLKFHGFRYTLVRKKFVDEEGLGNNTFLSNGDLEKIEEKVCSGWVFGWNSFAKELKKIEALTPDLNWEKEL